jgi:hypothetical protein
MQKIWSEVDSLHRNPQWWSQIISSMYGLNLERGTSIKFCMKLTEVMFRDNVYSQLCHLFLFLSLSLFSARARVNWYNYRFLPLIWQFFPILNNRIHEFVGNTTVIFCILLESVLHKIWSPTGHLYFLYFAIAISSSRWLRPGCTYFYQPNITDIMHTQ